MNYLFASFDLFNSAAYKYKNKGWFIVYKKALEEILKNTNNINEFTFWKALGDELVFKKELSVKNLCEDILKVNEVMRSIIESIYKTYKTTNPDIKQISIKTTMWIIHVDNGDTGSDYKLDINGIDDYIGKEMDTGFRISSYALRSKTILSASIINILLNNKASILNNIRIIGYSKLKGVWDNNEYPICVYFRNRNIEDSFHEPEKNINLVKEFLEKLKKDKKAGLISSSNFKEYLDYLGIKQDYDEKFV
ncbi:MAG: hypothetical protein JW870_02300 [Candidatus Delongbacteria bacterium]|nr:hypothetical protein [Candidatus Delongbacteria bacterium]